MSLRQLESYLDGLEAVHGFIPDVLLIDYPDLMRKDKDNYRVSIGELFEGVRGICVSRGMAGVTVTQGSKITEKAKFVDASDVAEDISKLATADYALTFSRTKQEKILKLARINLQAARNIRDGYTVLIAQNYDLGQFVTSSTLLHSDYFDMLKRTSTTEDNDE